MTATLSDPLPDDPEIGWGPDQETLAGYGLRAVSQEEAVIESGNGRVTIRYSMQAPLELMLQLIGNDHTKEKLDQYHLLEISREECIVHIQLPQPGLYACELFATEQGKDQEFLQNICNYIIKWTGDSHNSTYPFVPNLKTGMFSIATDLGIHSFHPQHSHSSVSDGTFTASMAVPDGIKLYAALYHADGRAESSNKCIKISKVETKVTIELEIMLSGQHSLVIYASVEGNYSQLYNIFNYLIDNKTVSHMNSDMLIELPVVERLHVVTGEVEIALSHSTNTQPLLAAISKEGSYLGLNGCLVEVTHDREECKVSLGLPADGLYTLHLYKCISEADKSSIGGNCLLMMQQYEILLEGSILYWILPVSTS